MAPKSRTSDPVPAAPRPFHGAMAGKMFRQRLATGKILPLIGVYDVFSALLAAERFEGIFLSGFGYAASAYGLPDMGFSNWHDVLDWSLRVRHVLPQSHLLVDIDDGFGEESISANTVKLLEASGVSAVQFEDQKRPRRCGHFEGKQILAQEQFLAKLKAVLHVRSDLFVIARTDATDMEDGFKRAVKYAQAGADGIMVEAVHDLAFVQALCQAVKVPVMVNQLHGGKSPNWTLDQMQRAGVTMVIYSTPCLFAAQQGISSYLDQLAASGMLPASGTATMFDCVEVLSRPMIGLTRKAKRGR
ncbi:MAG: isocitrate lyase/PEP mutase family protein [bacterium]